MKVYFLNCSSNLDNYNLCLEHKKAGFKFDAPKPGDLAYLIVKQGDGQWYCGARGVLATRTDQKPWPDAKQYTSTFDVEWERWEPFNISNGLKEIYSNYGLALQPAKVLFDSDKADSGFEGKGREFMDFMNAKLKPLMESFYPTIAKFLAQAETTNLKVAEYSSSFSELAVTVSFGKGNLARIPWISLLAPNHTTSCGIYPVYLLYKTARKLILAYGVSETNQPPLEWNVTAPTIETYFSTHNLGHPARYHNSQVFRVYDIDQPLSAEEIDQDLSQLIREYKSRLALVNEPSGPRRATPTSKPVPFDCSAFLGDLTVAGLFCPERLAQRFCTSLLAKPFVILTGLSGSGKTQLALSFARWLSEDQEQYCTVAVGADWTNRDALLGYPNALEQNSYILPETGVLSLLLNAAKPENQNRPFFLILDEMNLSHVERYFADFLSAMESGAPLRLHSGQVNWSGDVPPSLAIPNNLYIIGTINVDETTYMFSPKVLDRANVLEFRVSLEEMEEFLKGTGRFEASGLVGKGARMATSFLDHSRRHMPAECSAEIFETLISFFKELQPLGAEFGYRSADTILRFVTLANRIDPTWNITDILDAVIVQKLLPKVHGARRHLEPILGKMASLCVVAQFSSEALLGEASVPLEKIRFPLALEKIRRMYRTLCVNGFASFAEA